MSWGPRWLGFARGLRNWCWANGDLLWGMPMTGGTGDRQSQDRKSLQSQGGRRVRPATAQRVRPSGLLVVLRVNTITPAELFRDLRLLRLSRESFDLFGG